jgi:phosphohistidine phosphatase SixA
MPRGGATMPREEAPMAMIQSARLLVGSFALIAGLSGDVLAQDKPPPPAMDLPSLVHALQEGGYVIYFRHAATDQAKSDSGSLDLMNCATQRGLSEKGREQAQAIGKAFSALGIKISSVLASPYCRCIDTAKLAFGKATVVHDLEFAMAKSESETSRLGAVLRKYLAARPQRGTNTVIVAHSANLKEAVGIWPQPEGAAYVFQPQGEGAKYIGRVGPEQWPELARAK